VIAAGVWTTFGIAFAAAIYLAATWTHPHRILIVVLWVAALLGAVGVWVAPGERIIARRLQGPFFAAWSFVDVALIAAVSLADGGARSPFCLLFFLTLAFAALFYPLGLTIAVGALNVVAYLVVADASRMNLYGGYAGVWFFAACLTGTAFMCALQARNHDRRRRSLARRSRTDPLTGCLNRQGFEERLAGAFDPSLGNGRRLGVVVVDLDRFKEVNATLGHQVGDRLLKEVAGRLTVTLAPGETGARLGGDEFAVLMPDVPDEDAAVERAGAVARALQAPLAVDGVPLAVELSIGIATQAGPGAERLLRQAEVALYQAKASPRGLQVYARELDRHSPERLALIADLRPAVEEGQLSVDYQPIAELAGGRVVAAEALVRWQHPRRGTVPPDQFIPLAEQSTLIQPLTLQVIDQALGQCRAWQQMGMSLRVAVNLSARNLHDRELPRIIGRLLAEHAIAAHRLTLEITETAVMTEPEPATDVLAEFKAMGVRLAIDDFGTGYSSLAALRRLPVSELKIDRSFVSHMSTNRSDAAIVHSAIALASSHGLITVAEGVQTEATWDQLAALGCHLAQGFLLSPPQPASRLTPWLTRHTHGPSQTDDTPPPTAAPGQISHSTLP